MRRNRRAVVKTIEIVAPICIIGAWWFVTAVVVPSAGGMGTLFFPTPDKIAVAFWADFAGPDLLTIVGPTLLRFGCGIAIAVGLGSLLGLLIGMFRPLRYLAMPWINFFRSLPAVAIIPITTALFGLGDVAKVVIVVLAAIWSVLINTIDGVSSIDATVKDTARAFRVGPLDRLRFVVLPAAMPQAFAGIRVSVAVALIVTVLSELLGSSSGLGYFLLGAKQGFRLPDVWASLVMIGLLGVAINVVFMLIENWILAWHRGAKQSALAA